MKKFFSLIIGSIILISVSAQTTNLTLNLEKGKTYKQVTKSKTTITQEVNGQSMNMAMTMNGTMSFFVKSLDNDGFKLKMAKNGKISNVENVGQIWESVINDFMQVPETQRKQIKAQIMNAYSGKALKGNIEMATAIFPDKPVKKGDKWSVQTKLETGMAATINSNYEFSEIFDHYALVIGQSLFETTNKDAYVELNGMPMKYDLSGTMSSQIKVDKNTGWIIEAKINQNIKGNAYIKENQQIPNGMEIPMTIKSEMLITNN